MRKIILSISLLLGVILTALAQQPKDIDAKTFKTLMESNRGTVLDVRTPNEFLQGYIEGATNISSDDPERDKKLDILNRDKPIYVYCVMGARSSSVANKLTERGFKEVYNLSSGILGWKKAGFKVVKSEDAAPSSSKVYSVDEFNTLINSCDVVLIDFYAPWCAPCKKMIPSVDKLQSEYSGKLLVVKVDVTANDAISSKYKVSSVPHIKVIKGGNQVNEYSGLLTFDELKVMAEDIL